MLLDKLASFGEGKKHSKIGRALNLGLQYLPCPTAHCSTISWCVDSNVQSKSLQMRISGWLKLICSTGFELTKQANDDHVLSTIEDQEGRKLKVRSQYIFSADASIRSGILRC